MFDSRLYGYAVTSNQQNFLVKLLRNEAGIRANDGSQLQASNGMLTAFAADLQKLGGSAQSLSQQAQEGIIAQGIQWYYWQGNDYAGQRFFTDTGAGVLQYTTALGAGLIEAEHSNAYAYVANWLMPIVEAHGTYYNYNITSQYGQWSVVINPAGGTAQARDGNQSQMMVGAAGHDNLAGGNRKDLIFAGAGDDSLYGGTGDDTYIFNGDFGTDTVIDSDGQGRLVVDGQTLLGGNQVAPGRWVNEQQGVSYAQVGSGADSMLIIRRINGAGQIRVRGWSNGALGMHMSDKAPKQEQPERTRFDLSLKKDREAMEQTIRDRKMASLEVVNAISKNGGVVNSAAGNDLIVGGTAATPTHASILNGNAGHDVIWAGEQKESIQQAIEAGETQAPSGRSNVLLNAAEGDDQLIGDAGNDVLFGGIGNDTLVSGAGDDIIIADGEGVGLNTFNTTPNFKWALTDSNGAIPELRVRMQVATITTKADATGRRLRVLHYLDDVVSPLANTDMSGLLAMKPEAVGGGTTYGAMYGKEYFGTNVGRGDDVIYSGAGNDAVNAGAGNDYVEAGSGNDAVAGYEGDDTVFGGDGNDEIWGDASAYNPKHDIKKTEFGAVWTSRFELGALHHGQDVLDGGDGNDRLYGGGMNDVLLGGSGNDVLAGDDLEGNIHGAQAGNDYLDGGDGNDILLGGAGADHLIGGSGHDALVGDWLQDDSRGGGNDLLDGGAGDDILLGGAGSDTLLGGAGDDTLEGGTALRASDDGKIEIFTSARGAPQTTDPGADYLDGGAGNDYLRGDVRNDILLGGTGHDTLHGLAGDDSLDGGEGADSLYGGEGHDVLRGGAGRDQLYGEAGNDVLYGDEDNDTLDGGAGNDTLYGGEGMDMLYGGDGDDVLRGGDDYDNLYGGAGNDTLYGGADPDRLYGGDGADVLRGGEDGDYLYGGAGDDTLDGGAGNDQLFGEGGNNIYLFGRGDGQDTISNYKLISPDGRDILQFKGGINVEDIVISRGYNKSLLLRIKDTSDSVEISNYFYHEKSNNHSGVLNQIRFADGTVLNVDQVKKIVSISTAGDDVLFGYDEDDSLDGGDGNDFLSGEDGNDILDGGSGNDSLRGGEGNDTLYGGEGHDNLNGDAGNDVLDGGSGDDFLSGGEGDNALYGGEGRDTLYGGSGNEVLEGGAGNDSLNGGAGNDTLDGGTGDDRLEGGEGDDVYLFGRGDGRDVIFNNDYQSDKNIKRRDVLQFKENISQRDIFVSRYDNDIVLSIKETHDRVSISNYFSDDGLSDNGSALDKIRFADGSSWNVEQIKQMVQMSTAGNDTLYGYAINDVLDGGEGDDRLYGNDGNDTLIGGSGNDTLYGGKGGDTYLFGRGDGQDVIDNLFQNWDKNEKLEGSLDVLQFREDVRPEDVYINQRNEDLLIGIGGTDDNILVKGYFSKNGQSNYTLDLIKFSDGTNWSFEQVKQRIHLGTSFNDTLKGDTGDNVLWGYSGNDILDGGLGNDTLIGGTGDDTIYAGVGDDVIVHNKNDGHDTIIKEIEDGSITVKFGDGISISDLIFVRNDFVDEIQEDDYSLFPKNVINKNYYDATSLSLVIGDLGSLSSTNSITNHDGGYHSRIQFSHLEMDQSLRYSHYGSDQSNSALFDYKRSIPKNWKKDEFEYLPWNGMIPYNDNWYLAYKERTHYVVKRKKEVSNDLIVRFKNSDSSIRINNFFEKYKEGGIKNLCFQFKNDSTLSYADILQRILNESVTDYDDTIRGFETNDVIVGGAGNDNLQGGGGNDTIEGGSGNDTLVGSSYSIYWTKLNQYLFYPFGYGDDTYVFERGHGNDTIYDRDETKGNKDKILFKDNVSFSDLIFYRSGNDLIIKNKETNDSIAVKNHFMEDGFWAIEEIVFSNGVDAVIRGDDILNYVSPMPIPVDNDSLQGTEKDDNLNGQEGDDSISGLGGNDLLLGGVGNDTLCGDAGNDSLYDGEGDDKLYGGDGQNFLYGEEGNDSLYGGDDADQLYGDAGNDWLDGAAGNDNLYGGEGNDELFGNLGHDTIYGGNGRDALYGWYGDDQLHGDAGKDYLYGGEGNDTLYGGVGDDRLEGEGGNDFLVGDEGNDTLIGGEGSDTYVFGKNFGQDTIYDFYSTQGALDVAQFTEVNADQLWFRRLDSNLEISVIGTNEKVTINNWFWNSTYHVEQFKTADGKTLTDGNVDALVAAMAAFAPPALGQTTLSADYQSVLQPVIAANWK